MATLAQITAKAPETLTALERNHARRVLGVSPDPASTGYGDLEAVFDGLSAERNQEARAILADWDAIPAQPVVKSGGAKGITYETTKHRYEVYSEMARLLCQPVETYAVWVETYTNDGAQWVTISLPGLYSSAGDEYAG